MPLGLALITVKKMQPSLALKGILDSSYPKEFNISRGLIQKIVHIYNDSGKKEDGIMELKYSDKLILLNAKNFPDLDQCELIIIILSSEELSKTKHYFDLLAEQVPGLYALSTQDRVLQFGNFAKKFCKEQSSKKLLIIGFPSAGKTCIKKAFFDGMDPLTLLGQEAPEPTRGLAHYVYSWLDAEVGIIDSSGQEFESYVEPNNNIERLIAFDESDIIIYVFDIENWLNEKEEVISNLEKISNTRNTLSANADVFAFCHKIDLLTGTNQEKAKIFLNIKEELEKKFNIKTIFTSIQPELVHTLFRSMQIILNDMSQMGNTIEQFCEDVIKDQEKSAIFLLNDENVVISQKSTRDIDLDEISKIMNLVKNQQSILQNTPEFGELDYSVIHTVNEMALIVKSVNILKYGVSTVAYMSQSVSNSTLADLLVKLDNRFRFEQRKTNTLE